MICGKLEVEADRRMDASTMINKDMEKIRYEDLSWMKKICSTMC